MVVATTVFCPGQYPGMGNMCHHHLHLHGNKQPAARHSHPHPHDVLHMAHAGYQSGFHTYMGSPWHQRRLHGNELLPVVPLLPAVRLHHMDLPQLPVSGLRQYILLLHVIHGSPVLHLSDRIPPFPYRTRILGRMVFLYR